jgi:hypothetical protein
MSKIRVFSLGGLNLKVNPLLGGGITNSLGYKIDREGELLRSVNFETYPLGAKRLRSGYIPYLGTMPNGSQVNGLLNWTKNDGVTYYNYAFAGGNLYYSTQGTGPWTICGNGTLSPNGTLASAISGNTSMTLMIGDGISATRHSTDGTSFTNTTAAPVAVSFVEYHSKIFAAGTGSNLTWSTPGTPTDWISNSSTVFIPGAGKMASVFKSADRLIATKNSGVMFKYDEYNLLDMTTNLAPTSQNSIQSIEDMNIFINNRGFYSFLGDRGTLISNPIERQVFNDAGSGIIGTMFNAAPAVTNGYRYYCTIGTVTDDLVGQTIPDAVAVYDTQLNEWWNYSYANAPTAYLSYNNVTNGSQTMLFGAGSQVYQISGTATTDNGATINGVLMGVLTFGKPESDKTWKYFWAIGNPGCEAQIRVAFADTFTKGKLNWVDIGQFVNGVAECRLPAGSRGKMLFWEFTASTRATRPILYGFAIEAETIDRGAPTSSAPPSVNPVNASMQGGGYQ